MRFRIEAMVRRGKGSYYKHTFISNNNDVQEHNKALTGEGYEVLSVKSQPDDQHVFVDDNQGNMNVANGVLVESEVIDSDEEFVPDGGEDEVPLKFADLTNEEINSIEENSNGPN